MFQVVEKMLETLITTKPKTQDYNIYEYEAKFSTKKRVSKPKKLQRSPKIMGYYREDNEEEEASLGMFKEVIFPCSIMPQDMGQISCGIGSSDHSKDNTNNNKVINSNNVRVKVLLTKQEAAELLAKYASSEASLGAMDVVNELAKLPAQRISVVSVSNFCPDTTTLSTIPEEDEFEDEDEDEDEEQELLLKC